jgi:DNA polymerase-3 subunit epsilon
VVLDTETTGLRPEDGDRVVSLAGVRVRRGAVKPSEYFDALVNPGRPIPPASARFHGISDAMVAAAPGMEVVLPAFLAFTGGAALAGQEIWFDLRFLSREAARMGLPPLAETHAILDTRLLSLVVHDGEEEHDLDSVARRLGVPVHGRHSALGDALVTAEVLARLLPLLRKRGIVTLGQALDAARAVRDREAAS